MLEKRLKQPALSDSAKLQILIKLSSAYVETDLEKSFDYLEQAEGFAIDCKDTLAMGHIELNRGTYYDSKSDLKNSISHYFKAIRLYEVVDHKSGIADAKLNLSAISRQYGDQNNSIKYLQEALVTYQYLNDTLSMGIVKLNLCASYTALGDLAFAMELAEESLQLAKKSNDSIGIAYAIQALSANYVSNKDFKKAILQSKKAIPIIDALHLNYLKPSTFTTLGFSYLHLKQYDSSLFFLEKSLSIATRYGYANQRISALLELADYYLELKKYSAAESFAQRAYHKSDSLKMPALLQRSSFKLAQIYGKTYEYELANKFLLEAYNLKDTLLDRSKIQEAEKAKFTQAIIELEKEKIDAKKQLVDTNESLGEQRLIVRITLSFLALFFFLLLLLFHSYNRANKLVKVTTKLYAEKNEATERLQELHEEMKAYSYILVHDLKTPLNSVKSIAHLLEIQGKAGSTKDLLLKTANNGLALIDKIMEVTESEQVTVNMQQVSMRSVFDEIHQEFHSLAEAKNLSLRFTAGIDLVTADPFLVKRALHNLVSNAIKFSPHGMTIFICVVEEDDSITIQVADQGPGFKEDDKKNIYKRFKKLSARPTGNESSHGLGLVTVKAMVEKMGASLSLESKHMEGAKFTIRLKK
ncbi:MAG: ATP-binding protein [Cyclobacteriaceae bacterium]